jgi:hypothetical protein
VQLHHLVELHELVEPRRRREQLLLATHGVHVGQQRVERHGVVAHVGKHVEQQRAEEADVGRHQLGLYGLAHAAHQQLRLEQLQWAAARARVADRVSLQPAGRHEHTLERAQPKVVVLLVRELLGAQPEQRHDLAREALGRLEALRVEHHLPNELAIGLDHRNAPEQLLEIVRQLGTAGISRIHGDEDAHVAAQRHGALA